MITFYTNPMSRGRTARWMLEEVGQPYDTVVLDYGTMKTPEYLAVNPMGKVPALVHGGKVVTEVPAILCYLAEAFPEARLMPEDRAGFYRWMFFAAGPLEQAVVNSWFGWTPTSQEERVRTGYGSMETVLDVLTDHLSRNDYVVDGRFTAVDVYLGNHVARGAQFGMMPVNDTLVAYFNRLKDRPARLTGAAKDAALVPKEE